MNVSKTAEAGMIAMAVNIRKYVMEKQRLEAQKAAAPSPKSTVAPAPSIQRVMPRA